MKNSADVVIVGGGCMGVSTAYHLARAGVRDIILVEREPFLGSGSTGRNAGGVRHQFSTEANVLLSIESIGFFERFHEETGQKIDFHQDGYLFLLSSEQSVLQFQRNVELQRQLGVEVDWLTPEATKEMSPALSIEGLLGATYCVRDGICDPNGVTMGFAKAARDLGVTILRDTEVTDITAGNGAVSGVVTSQGLIATEKVVNAAGPYAGTIGRMAGINVPVAPYRRHIFVTEPLPADDAAGTHRLSTPRNHLMVIDFDTTFYFHREGAGLLFGMSDPEEPEGFDITVKWEFLEKISPVASLRLPGLMDVPIAHAWAGLYEMTPDAMPIIGPIAELEGYYIVAGFSGHGFQHCPAAGRLLAAQITGEQVVPLFTEQFSFERFRKGGILPEKNVV